MICFFVVVVALISIIQNMCFKPVIFEKAYDLNRCQGNPLLIKYLGVSGNVIIIFQHIAY